MKYFCIENILNVLNQIRVLKIIQNVKKMPIRRKWGNSARYENSYFLVHFALDHTGVFFLGDPV